MVDQSVILAMAIAFSLIMMVSGTNICDNAPCEPQINTSIGEEFAISLESNPSAGFEWWTKFDPNYLSLVNLTFISENEMSGMVGVPGKHEFIFNAISAGNTDVIMLLIQPWKNGTIAEPKIFPINIISAATAPKQPISLGGSVTPEHSTIRKSSFQSSSGMGTNTISNGQTMATTQGTSSSYFFKNESVMETPSQASSQIVPDINDLSPHGKSSF
jgi:predicted secreted protein